MTAQRTAPTAFSFLPEDSVIRDASEIARRYQRNISGLVRSIPIALRPQNAQEVEAIVREANVTGQPLYPFSTGKNWGLGSKLPVTDGCAVLDLSRMNRIVEVNESALYAVIEPGVTQGQLADYLAEHHPTLFFNLTGTFGETSVMGNVLERGDGGHARIDDLIALRGFLGNGKPFEVDGHFSADGSDKTHVGRYTAGPDLVGIFTQGNFAVVTHMVFRLCMRAQQHNLFWGVVENAKLGELFDRFRHLFAQQIIRPAKVNVGYANRFEQARSTLGDKTADMRYTGELWNYYITYEGSAAMSQVITEELRTHLTPCFLETNHYVSGQSPELLPPYLRPIVRPLAGFPDRESIRLVYKLTNTPEPENSNDLDVDQTPFGMKSYVAVVPPVAGHVRKAADIVATIRERFKINSKLSFFGDGRTLITIHFLNADPEQVKLASQAESAIWDSMAEAGYLPYRVAIDQMERLMQLRSEFFGLVKQMKAVFDPNGIIAPGRYCPL